MNIQELLKTLTFEQATDYAKSEEQWLFCSNLLDVNNVKRTDSNIQAVENRLLNLIGQ